MAIRWNVYLIGAIQDAGEEALPAKKRGSDDDDCHAAKKEFQRRQRPFSKIHHTLSDLLRHLFTAGLLQVFTSSKQKTPHLPKHYWRKETLIGSSRC